jgi:hypothetical protein
MRSLSSTPVLVRAWLLGALVATVATVSACGAEEPAGDAAGTWPAVARPLRPSETEIEGGSQAQRAALRDLLTRMGSTGIQRLVVERPNDEWKQVAEGSANLTITPVDRRDSQAQWEAAVLAGAFDERSRAEGLPELAAYNGPDGSSRVAGPRGGEGEPAARGPAPDVASLRESVRAAVSAQDADVTGFRVSVLNSRPVAAIDLRAEKPAEFLRRELPFILAALPRTLDGSYVGVRDEDGDRVLESGWFDAGHVAGGLLWVKPQLDSCSPIAHSEPALAEPPPACPFGGAQVFPAEGVQPTRTPDQVEEIARLGADGTEKVLSLAVDERPALCRTWGLDRCPGAGGRVMWLATLGPVDAWGRPAGPTPWLAIEDRSGRVVGQGASPAG